MQAMIPGQMAGLIHPPTQGLPPAPYEEQAEGEQAAPTGRKAPDMIDAPEVIKRWKQAEKSLQRDRNNYQLNQSFYQGEQWVRIVNRNLQELAWERDDEWLSRTTIDKFGPRTRSLVSRLLSEDLDWEAQADGLGDVEQRQKQTREQILRGLHDQDFWEDTREDTLLDVLFGGAAAVAAEWDPQKAGDDDSIIDPTTGFSYATGGPMLTPLSICDFCIEPGVSDWRTARWWIKATGLPPEIVQERYNLPEKPAADVLPMLGARQRSLIADYYQGDTDDQRNTAVYVFYQKPCNGYDGYELHVVNAKVVEKKQWAFPWDQLNLYVFRAQRQRGKWTGTTLLTTARPVQASLNHIRSTIMEHARKAANARLMVPEGTVPDEDVFTDGAGDIVRYSPDPSGQRPDWMNAPQVPRWLSAEAEKLEADLDDIFHTHDVTRGEAPGTRNSGLALSILAEKDDTPLSSIARDQARGWGELGKMVLLLMKKNQPEGGVITLSHEGTPTQVPWKGDDIGTNPRVLVPLKNTMPRTKAATMAALTSFLQLNPAWAQAIDLPAAARMVGFNDPQQFLQTLDNDEALAEWENSMIANGVPIAPDLFNDQSKHIVTHEAEQNTPGYMQWVPERQQLMQEHIDAHKKLEAEKAMQQAQQQAAQGAPGLGAGPGAMGALPPGAEPGPGEPPPGGPGDGMPPGSPPPVDENTVAPGQPMPPGLPGMPPGPPQ